MLDRKSAPAYQRSVSYFLPQPKELSSHAIPKLWHIPYLSQQVVKIEIIFRSGKYFEDQPGVSHFTSHMIEKGTDKHDALAITKTFDQYGAHLEIHPGFDHVSISLYSTTNNLSKTLPLLIEVISAPSFPEKELELFRGIFIQNLKVNQEKNSYLASKQIRKNLFGGHVYGSSAEIEDSQSIHVKHLKTFFETYFHATEVFVIGNILEDDLNTFKRLLQPSTIPPDINRPLNISKPFTETLDKPSSVQSSIRLAKQGLPMNHMDYPAFLAVNHLLGGFFGSRLMKNIREEKGLSYGIYSGITHLAKSDFITIGADVNREQRGVAVDEIRNELCGLSQISSSELVLLKNHLIGLFQNELNTIFAVADKIKTQFLFELPQNYFQGLIAELDKLKIEQLETVAKTYFNPDDFFLVTVG